MNNPPPKSGYATVYGRVFFFHVNRVTLNIGNRRRAGGSALVTRRQFPLIVLCTAKYIV